MITSERNQYVGAHITRRAKRAMAIAAQQQSVSMSKYISDAVERALEADGVPLGDRNDAEASVPAATAA